MLFLHGWEPGLAGTSMSMLSRSETRDAAQTRLVSLDNLPVPGRGLLRRAVAAKPSLQQPKLK